MASYRPTKDTKLTMEILKDMPTLAVGQCCSLKVDSFPTRVWLCRGDGSVSIEMYNPSAGWYNVVDHGQQEVELCGTLVD